TFERSSPLRLARWLRVWARSSWGCTPERAPLPALPRPRGVRTASRMNTSRMKASLYGVPGLPWGRFVRRLGPHLRRHPSWPHRRGEDAKGTLLSLLSNEGVKPTGPGIIVYLDEDGDARVEWWNGGASAGT